MTRDLEKEISFLKNRKQTGWVVPNEDGTYSKYVSPRFTKDGDGWCYVGAGWSDITPEQVSLLCNRLPKWTDTEPTPIYK